MREIQLRDVKPGFTVMRHTQANIGYLSMKLGGRFRACA